MSTMEFPYYHHPALHSQHQPGRQLFSDYSDFGGLGMEQAGGSVNYVPQKCRLQPGELRYSAEHPSLPLLSTPAQVKYPFSDRISSARLDRKKKLKVFSKRLLRHRGNSVTGRGAWDDDKTLPDKCKKTGALIREVKAELGEAIASRDVPAQNKLMDQMFDKPWLKKCVGDYIETGGLDHLEAVNWAYTGGCLAAIPREDNHLVISPSGDDWNSLAMVLVSETDQSFCKAEKLPSMRTPASVYELHCQKIYQQAMCALRMKDSCALYEVRNSESASSPVLSHLGREMIGNPTSICLSPFIPAEVLIATEDGDAVLWTPEKSKEVVIRGVVPRFKVDEPWRQCQFGAHPRLITMADRSMIQLYDIRTGCINGTDLFALPSMTLHKGERIQVTMVHRRIPFYHLVATDYSILLLDQRFPGHPIIQWSHMLDVPQYLSMTSDPLNGCDDLVLIGSQFPPETFIYSCNMGSSNRPPQSTCLPWRVSRMDDISLFPELSGVVRERVRKERFSSLAGIALLHNNNVRGSFTALQLDCHGDVFYQCYDRRTLSGEITQSAGPGSEEVKLCERAIELGRVWLRELAVQADSWFTKTRTEKKQKILDASDSFIVVSQQKYAHVLCALCMPQTCDPGVAGEEDVEDGGPSQSYGPSGGDDEELCHVCGYTLGVTRRIAQSNLQDEVVNANEGSCDWDVLLPSSTPLLGCQLPLSQMMTKEWNGETDIDELLVAHDKLLTARNQELIRERKEALKSQANEDEDKKSTGLLAMLREKVKNSDRPASGGSEKTRSSTPSHSGTPSRSNTPPSRPDTPPRPPTLPGFGSTPVRLVSRQTSSASEGGNTSSPRPTNTQSQQFKEESMFEFLSQKPPRPLSRSTPPSVKRRKKHVSGF